jgi:hypothetical protein
MFRKLAVALIAATVFTAPVLAQSTAPAKNDAAPATTAPATTAPATTAPKADRAKPTVRHAHHVRRVHHVRHAHHVRHMHHVWHKHHVRHGHHVKHVKHVMHVKKHHKVAKITRKGATYMRAVPATHPAMKAKKPAQHTMKTTHRVKQVRLTQKSTTPARSDAPAAPKSVN